MKRLAAVLAIVPGAALAHPGDHQTSGLWHLLTEPDHLLMIVAGVAVSGWVAFILWSRS